MKKIIFLLLVCICFKIGNSQNTTTQNLGAPRTLVVNKGGFQSDSSLIVPHFSDTALANISPYVKYYAGNIIRVGNTLYMRNSTATQWISVGSGGGGSFTNNIIMNADASNRLGYWVNGETIPVAGKTLDEAFTIITQKAVHPTYTYPQATITGNPSAGNYEIGYNFGTITFDSNYIKNDGGNPNGATFKRGTTSLPGNTDTCYSLISTRSYSVQISYDSGLCKNNNLGVIDCTGRIPAGTATSNTISYIPVAKRYWGYLNSYGSPSSANVISTAGGSSKLSTLKSSTDTVTVSGSNKYIYLAYPKSYGVLTSLIMGGFETLPAFSPPFTVSVTNAQGYTQDYYVYINVNPFNAGSVSFTTQ